MARLEVVDGPLNDAFDHSERGGRITVARRPLIDPDSTVFAMGSCFAVEIRAALRRAGLRVVPAYFDIPVDLDHVRIGRLPRRDNVNHYDTFAIRHEFEQAFGLRPAARAEEFWSVESPAVREGVGLGSAELYQNPFRKRVFADSLDRLAAASRAIDDTIRAGVLAADVYVITLGMTETWRDRATGRYLCRRPDGEHLHRCELVVSDVVQNLENLRHVCALLAEHRPGRPVVLTVSPVAINRTYSGGDVVVANTGTKSLLRTVAGQMEREFDDVHYWPSYELALRADLRAPDGRHVSDEGVATIVEAFLAAHLTT